ncbi:GerMN domain-containing protein [Desulfotomaculum copahuensis]|uniref:GerMN domain-containing protein n=1 Tax=Desulfotomaculum copahuensis TaxID=1838280 RepID=A0A1B7LKW7_9FIRM|nr:GerMN domain-containing protein [Desulfotomaculum copahuensis]OAT87102.1 hypothetical protein A6M21_02095 [Desulfotomaculum copahuensis]
MPAGKMRQLSRYLVIPVLGLFLSGCLSPVREGNPLPGLGIAAAQQTTAGIKVDSGSVPGKETGIHRKTVPVTLYFGEDQGYLVPVKKETTGAPAVARAAMQELCRGPAPGSGLNPTIPPGTTLRNINIKDGLATVDFSRELKTRHGGGSTEELLTVYSIVDTLTRFPSVRRVQILVDGKRLETLTGHMDISMPLERDNCMIRESGH